MNRRNLLTAAVACTLFTLTSQAGLPKHAARSASPGQVADRCLAVMDRIAQQTISQNQKQFDEATAIIQKVKEKANRSNCKNNQAASSFHSQPPLQLSKERGNRTKCRCVLVINNTIDHTTDQIDRHVEVRSKQITAAYEACLDRLETLETDPDQITKLAEAHKLALSSVSEEASLLNEKLELERATCLSDDE